MQRFGDEAHLPVGRTKVVAPLRDAVRLVDHDARQQARAAGRQPAERAQELGEVQLPRRELAAPRVVGTVQPGRAVDDDEAVAPAEERKAARRGRRRSAAVGSGRAGRDGTRAHISAMWHAAIESSWSWGAELYARAYETLSRTSCPLSPYLR